MTNRTQPETPAGGPLGDTGHGDTGVPNDKQGMSNRPGDRATPANAAADEDQVDEDELDEHFSDGDELDTPGQSTPRE